MLNIQEHPDGVAVKIKVQPRSSKNSIAGVLGDALKITLTAPPVDGAANAACIDFFSSTFKIPKARVEILNGHASRTKFIKLYGISLLQFNEIAGKLT